ncbi:unnamed protein product, partial [Mycena citricolor]
KNLSYSHVLLPKVRFSCCGSENRLRCYGRAYWLLRSGQQNHRSRRYTPRRCARWRNFPWPARHRKHWRQLPAHGRRSAAGQPHARAHV